MNLLAREKWLPFERSRSGRQLFDPTRSRYLTRLVEVGAWGPPLARLMRAKALRSSLTGPGLRPERTIRPLPAMTSGEGRLPFHDDHADPSPTAGAGRSVSPCGRRSARRTPRDQCRGGSIPTTTYRRERRSLGNRAGRTDPVPSRSCTATPPLTERASPRGLTSSPLRWHTRRYVLGRVLPPYSPPGRLSLLKSRWRARTVARSPARMSTA